MSTANENALQVARERDKAIAWGAGGVQIRTLDDASRFAQWVSQSEMAPKGCDKPAAILIALQHGAELGLSEMQSIQSIAVINGRPVIYGDGLRALILSHPLCEGIMDHYEGEGDHLSHVTIVRRKGWPEPVTRRFSVADAKRAGLWDKPGPWKSYPQRMLQWRSFSWAARDAFADVLRGIAVAEEQEDSARMVTVHDVSSRPLTPPRAIEGPSDMPSDADVPIDETPSEPAPPVSDRKITAAEAKGWWTALKGHGRSEEDARIYLSERVGVSETKDMPHSALDAAMRWARGETTMAGGAGVNAKTRNHPRRLHPIESRAI